MVKLELDGPIPSWIGKLDDLRPLQCCSSTKQLPARLAALPHLANLHLDGSNRTSLAGLENLKALENITFGSTPVAHDTKAIALGRETRV